MAGTVHSDDVFDEPFKWTDILDAGAGPSLLFPRGPGKLFPGRPGIPPLACPCHCEDDCPRTIQIICCFTPGSRAQPDPDPASASASASASVSAPTPDVTPEAGGVDGQQSLLNSIHAAPAPASP